MSNQLSNEMAPKKNKKPSKNGYWQFVLECRDKIPNRSMEEAKEIAARKWTNMTKEERKPYEEMAALARDSFRTAKLTTDGYEIEEVERQKKEAENRIQEMKNDIVKTFRTASLEGNLEEHIFILIHINHLTYYPAGDKFFICEVGMASVNLRNGIKEIYHQTVKPGRLPLGFYGPALAHSKETHQLMEMVHDEPYEDNSAAVFYEMVAFMKKYCVNRPLTVFSDEKTFEMTKKVLENFREECEFEEEIRVYNMQYMFFALKNAAAGCDVWPTETFSYNEIERDVYCFIGRTGCDFHEVADNSTYCSKSIVTRYAYTICDNCCGELGIALIPGKHVPLRAKISNKPGKSAHKSPSTSSSGRMSVTRTSPSPSTSSRSYEDHFPELGGSRSSAPSVVSFSSMRSPQPRESSLTAPNVAALERSFESTSITPPRRNHRNLKFPEKGYKSPKNNPSQ